MTQVAMKAHTEPDEIPSVTRLMAEFASKTRWQDLPAFVREEAKRSFVNIVGTMFAGSQDKSIQTFVRTLEPLMGQRQSTMVGYDKPVDVASAAFLNAASGNVLEFDDTDPETLIHPSAIIFGALLAIAEQENCSGQDILCAFAVGTEIDFRLGAALGPGHYERGWHITPTCGTVGAAAALGNLLRFSTQEISNAIGIAATSASGLIENMSSSAKSVGVGNAARNALYAALLARQGADAADNSIEGPRGFFALFSDDYDPSAAVTGLGQRWDICKNRAKPYAACLLLHPLVDAVLELRDNHGVKAEDLAEVVVRGHPLQLAVTDRMDVNTAREAKLSIQYTAAVAFVRGTSGVLDYLDGHLADEKILSVQRLVKVEADRTISTGTGIARVKTKSGKALESTVEHGRGSLKRPLNDAEVSQKATSLIAWAAPRLDAKALVDTLWTAEKAHGFRDFLAKLAIKAA